MQATEPASVDAARTTGRPLDTESCCDPLDEQPASKRPRANNARSNDVEIDPGTGTAPAAAAAAASARTAAASSETAPVSGALLACEREVSGRHRKEIFGLLHRAADALGHRFALTATRLDGAPSVLFIACNESDPQSGSESVPAAADPSSSTDASRDREGTIGVQALVERLLQSIGRAELWKPASKALLRLSPVQMRVQPGSLEAVAAAIPALLDPVLGDSAPAATFAVFFRRHSLQNNKNAAKKSRSGGEKDLWVSKLAGLVPMQHTVCIGDPEFAVLVDVCGRDDESGSSGEVAFLCVAPRSVWWRLRRFSLRELASKGLRDDDTSKEAD